MDGRVMGNVYEVEHLATFQLSEELNAPSDGMRRLLHMQTNGLGIWSQKIRVHLEQNFIVILDFQNGVSFDHKVLIIVHKLISLSITFVKCKHSIPRSILFLHKERIISLYWKLILTKIVINSLSKTIRSFNQSLTHSSLNVCISSMSHYIFFAV